MTTTFNPDNYQTVLTHCDSVKQNVTLIAVTKYTSVEAMRQAYDGGVRHFGENKVQDLLEKQDQFPREEYPDLNWHMIGHLQSNKVNKVVGKVALIHSVDSLKLLEKINDAALRLGVIQRVLIQVNISDEASKSGLAPMDVKEILDAAQAFSSVKIEGLMTMAPLLLSPSSSDADNIQAVEGTFSGLQQLQKKLKEQTGLKLSELSMGMSGDYQLALNHGASMIRVGSYLFSN